MPPSKRAVEAATEFCNKERETRLVERALGAAAPIIRSEEREALREKLLEAETIRSITKQIVGGSDGEVLSLSYSAVRDALADHLFASSQPLLDLDAKGGSEFLKVPTWADAKDSADQVEALAKEYAEWSSDKPWVERHPKNQEHWRKVARVLLVARAEGFPRSRADLDALKERLTSDEAIKAVKERWFTASQEFYGNEDAVAAALIEAAWEAAAFPDTEPDHG